jgi:tetratricopeptide (TPR) repeat protein
LNQYPNFIAGYYSRAEAKRKIRDLAGADRDVWTAYQMEQGNRVATSSSNTGKNTGAAAQDKADDNTREKSDKNINKFNRLVVYDKEEERKTKYQSEVRGRVQDKNVRVDIEPQVVLTYYEKPDQVKKLVYYDKMLENYNSGKHLPMLLRLTNQEAALNEEQVAKHFTSINNYSAKIETDSSNVHVYFGRALDYMLVQDFSEALQDYDKAILLDPSFAIAYFNRAVVRYKQ